MRCEGWSGSEEWSGSEAVAVCWRCSGWGGGLLDDGPICSVGQIIRDRASVVCNLSECAGARRSVDVGAAPARIECAKCR